MLDIQILSRAAFKIPYVLVTSSATRIHTRRKLIPEVRKVSVRFEVSHA